MTWSEKEIKTLIELYPHTLNKDIEKVIGRTVRAIKCKAHSLGLKKIENKGCFKKGNIPYNKGKKLPPEILEKIKRTQFKKGHIPCNILPIGTEVDVKGYIYVKVSDIPKVPKYVNWKLKHRLLWESVNGEIPKGYNIQFKDNNPKNITIENLYIISQSEQMKVNSFMHLPKEARDLLQAIRVLTRQINKFSKNEQ